jgi:glucose/arabinose dehydrogenase
MRSRTALGAAIAVTVCAVAIVAAPRRIEAAPALIVQPVMSNLDHPWDVAFTPDGTMLVTERAGRLWARTANGAIRQVVLNNMNDFWASGETGLMGIEVDPAFPSNRRIYTCQGTVDASNTVQVVAWTVNGDYSTATRANDPLVGGIDGSSGRHGGCQLRIDPADGALWIGTGDAATGTNPQSASALAGKVLRVNRFNGQGVAGNPFLNDGGNRSLMYTYGHRNVQGLARNPATGQMWSVEHGPDRDDEINQLLAGRNYGWDPVPDYNESVPMTDFAKFPGAVGALWSSGPSTIAASGATFLQGEAWGPWQGALALSALKDARLRILFFDGSGRFTGQVIPPELNGTYGRLRAAELEPNGVLYLTTDNGGGSDVVLAVAPVSDDAGVSAVAGQSGSLELVTRGTDDAVLIRSWTTSSDSGWASIGGVGTSDPDATSWGGDRLDVVVRGTDGAVWHRGRQNGSWSQWTTLGGQAVGGPAIVAAGVGRLDVFVRGVDNALWVKSFANGAWSGWATLGGDLTADPDAVARGPGALDVFVRGRDGALWVGSTSAGAWQGWQYLGGILTSGPGAAALGGSRVDVFVRGNDRALYHRVWYAGLGWTGWDLGIGQLTSAPEGVWRATNWLDVFVRGNDTQLWQLTWTGSTWSGFRQLG